MANKIVGGLIALATILFLLLTPVLTTVFSTDLYQQFYSEDFKTNKENQEFLTITVLEYISGVDVAMTPFSRGEISHLQDVKQRIDVSETLVIVAGFILLIFVPLIWWKKRNHFLALQPVMIGSIIAFVIALIIAGGSYFAFEPTFTILHKIVFPHGGWQFVPDSLLILLFPINVFIVLATRIFIIMLSMSGLLAILTWFTLYRLRSTD